MSLFSSQQAAAASADPEALIDVTSATAPPAPRKRKAYDSEPQPGIITPTVPPRKHKHPRTYKNHATHWEDGEVYIRAGATRFKLHKSRLARLSPWFQEIFEQNAHEDTQPAMEVVLDKMGVSAEDFTALLDALDNSIKYTYTKPTFHEVAAILRASTILSFETFIPWARQYLEDMWPAALNSVTTTCTPLATESIILARRCYLPSVLKRALYELVRMEGFGQIYVIKDDGEDEKPEATLSAADHILLTKAREKLGSRWIEVALSLPKDSSTAGVGINPEIKLEDPQDDVEMLKPQPLCVNVECTFANPDDAHRVHRKLVHDSRIFATYIWDPICGIQALLEAPWADEGCCAICVDKLKAGWQGRKEGIWKDLDVWFGLGHTG